jgi:hypothetical protein
VGGTEGIKTQLKDDLTSGETAGQLLVKLEYELEKLEERYKEVHVQIETTKKLFKQSGLEWIELEDLIDSGKK